MTFSEKNFFESIVTEIKRKIRKNDKQAKLKYSAPYF